MKLKLVLNYIMLCLLASSFGCVSDKDNTGQSAGNPPVGNGKSGNDKVATISEAAIDEATVDEVAKKSIINQTEESVDISHKYGYKVREKNYKVFSSAKNFQEIGTASWYGPGFHGRKTANGEIYNMHAMTAAHKTLPLGVSVKVSNLENGKHVVVRINDRGPFHAGRVIDVSKAAGKKLGIMKNGYARVHVKVVE